MSTQNRLAGEKSPYLLQHRDNPVDWYPWGQEAFDRARELDRPVFLSVGYSTCHWCHVMAHESFESEAIAQILNDHFVSVKVDREERPDVDGVYMMALQIMTGRAGWPMSVFLTADGRPFYAGTYFPPEDRPGRPGFPRLLQGVISAWTGRREDIETQGQKLIATVAGMRSGAPAEVLPAGLVQQCVSELESDFDAQYGGFGGAPKFPRSSAYGLLMRTGGDQAVHMVVHTLGCIAGGGITDHLGGGFSRYSTDERWLVPHFEKMLYDNAQLIVSYLELYQLTGEERWAQVARDGLEYVLRDLRSPAGGFYSAEDADSEGREGAFYVWTPQALEEVLGAEDAKLAAAYYGVTPQGNFERAGESVLSLAAGTTPSTDPERLEQIRVRLLAARELRERPSRDEKVLAAWNGLMIRALAFAYRILRDERYLDAAREAAAFVADSMVVDGQLQRRWCDGEARFAAYLDDYMLLSEGLVELYEVSFERRWLEWASRLVGEACQRFWDPADGGFFYSAEDQDTILEARMKDASDGAIPSGNSVAVHVLLKLWGLTGVASLRDRAVQTLLAFGPHLIRGPRAYPYMLSGLADLERGLTQVVIAGRRGEEETEALLDAAWRTHKAGAVLCFAEPGDPAPLPLASCRDMEDGRATAYVCENFVCNQPVHEPERLVELLTAPAATE